MASNTEEHQEKEGVSIADIVKCMVLLWSATLLTVSYLGFFPKMKMDNTFVASLLTGAMHHLVSSAKATEEQTRNLLSLTTKIQKPESNEEGAPVADS